MADLTSGINFCINVIEPPVALFKSLRTPETPFVFIANSPISTPKSFANFKASGDGVAKALINPAIAVWDSETPTPAFVNSIKAAPTSLKSTPAVTAVNLIPDTNVICGSYLVLAIDLILSINSCLVIIF